jgi:protein-tyrosine-phosphatase
VACGAASLAGAQTERTALFICEHGYAKSLVAALHFQRLAQERGIAFRALSRGAAPGSRVPDGIQAGLAADGFDVHGFVPSRPTHEEINDAAILVLIGVNADVTVRAGPVIRWDAISPLSENYERARSEIVALASALLDEVAATAAVNRAPISFAAEKLSCRSA